MHAKGDGLPKRDYSPRNFMWVMRKEVAIFALSICVGLSLPYWYHLSKEHNKKQMGMIKNNQTFPPQQQN